MYEDLPRTKREAQQLGAKRYFTGRLCCHGHLSPRYTYGERQEFLKFCIQTKVVIIFI